MANGYKFHTKNHERDRKIQNSGIVMKDKHGNNINYFYGIVKEIIKVRYWIGN